MFWKVCELLLFIKIIETARGQGSSAQTFNFEDNENWLELDSPCSTSKGTSGLCKRPSNCPVEKFKLTLEDICYFEGKVPVVCCESGTTQSNPNNNPFNSVNPFGFDGDSSIGSVDPVGFNGNPRDSPVNPIGFDGPTNEKLTAGLSAMDIQLKVQLSNKTADKKCVEYYFPEIANNGSQWNNNKNYFAYAGGVQSRPKDNPQMAAVGWRTIDGGIDWKCGGSLIDRHFILTAAHCAYSRGAPANVVRIGDLNLLNDTDVWVQQYNITDIFVHPNYKRGRLYNDIALFKFAEFAIFNNYIKAACLWTEFDIPVTNLIAMGYGTDAFAGKVTNELFEGNLTLVPNESCRQSITSNFQIPSGIIESQMCAKDPEGKSDTCQGDSGGPLVFRTGTGSKAVQHLVGITSFGEFCAGSTPGVYTRVSSYIDWIESIVWPSGQL